MNHFLKIYLPVYLLLYLFFAFVWPSYRTWQQTRVNPVTFGREDTAHNYIGFVMKLLLVLLFCTVLIFSLSNELYSYLIPVQYLQSEPFLIAGLIIVHLALAWVIIAQYQMSTSWRIGIDEINKTKLVTNGVFSLSRNPIFLGMIITVFGLFLILPNAMTFFLTATTYLVIQIQIRLEEAFLEKQHGSEYKAYKSRTRRLI